ncbi:EVE domain-containing protein [Croceibacterium aestuarii]|uniref:EVE domain-containing protein n=1 Tax=Croceibacterium aestuarii TaxID=3064139 RepID=UPI00272E2CBE|nr:EVE domain-containing protein [Croceibacterium sp. D39]
MAKRLWLMKSEPAAYSYDQLVEDGRTIWDGVRNYRARNNLQAMQVGDEAFFYHSVSDKEIVGIVRVVKAGMTDPKDDSGTWAAVEIEPVRKFERPVSLAAIKAEPTLQDIELIRLSRLSVAEIRPAEWEKICSMATA